MTKQVSLEGKVVNGNGANLGFEQKLWKAADKLRNNMDAAEYKHVVLGLIFLKYISDAFEELREELANDPESLPTLNKSTNTKCETSSGFQQKQDGASCRKTRNNRLLALPSMMPWMQ